MAEGLERGRGFGAWQRVWSVAEGLEHGRGFGAWQRVWSVAEGLSRDHLGIVKYLSRGQLLWT